jgi:acetyltransferase-like isoleucine patch superfamily enzyme
VTIEVEALGTNRLEIGDATMVFDRATFDLDGGTIAIADHCQIRTSTLIKSSARVTIGSRSIFSYNASIHCAAGIVLEDWSQIAERTTVVDSDHELDGSDVYAYDRPVNATPIVVGRNTFVGSNSVVTRGARLGRNAAVGACSVVTAGDYPDGWLIAGSPAKAIRSLGDLADRRRSAESAV